MEKLGGCYLLDVTMTTKMGPIKLKKQKQNNNTIIGKNIIFPYHMVRMNTSIVYLLLKHNSKEKLIICPKNLILALSGAQKGKNTYLFT